ncbi:chemotaxis protein CheB [Aminobacter aganoensis]|nr:chemotaxis protein CheB [Aminobacter aganoensis]
MPNRTSSLKAARDNHCLIAIGASSGGVEPLKQIVRDLPSDLAASVFVVLHIGPVSHLAGILDRAGPLHARTAVNGAIFKRGNIYVAPPNYHLLIHDDHIMLRRGPRENLSRPAIDPLFRSAALSFGPRVIGVVLSGSLSDGTAGLRAIKAMGGLAVVQDPQDAAVPAMINSAMRYVDVDHTAPAADIGALLGELAVKPAGEASPAPPHLRLEAAIAAQEHSTMQEEDRLGEISVFICPECHGPLWEIEDGDMVRYRCHTGHAFTSEAMLEAQSVEVDEMLWSLLRAHQQRAEFTRRMAQRESKKNLPALAAQLAARAQEYTDDARVIERILESRQAAVSEHEATPEQEHGKKRSG